MLYRTSIFRLSNFAYRSATKKKLNLFINAIIFISIFALTASGLSMYYENKIDKLDKKIALYDSQKIILENQLTIIPVSLGLMDTILDSNLSNRSNYEILKEVKIQDEEVQFTSERQNYFRQYYDAITSIYVATTEIHYLILNAKLIFKNDESTLDKINQYEKKNEEHKTLIDNLDKKAVKLRENWDQLESENLISEYGSLGINLKGHINGALISDVGENTPASRSNLEIGDIILSINNVSLSNLELDEIYKNFKYPPNIAVELEVKNKGIIKIITEEVFNEDVLDLKDTEYYLKFESLKNEVYKIIEEQRTIYLDFGLKLTSDNLESINNQKQTINNALKDLSKKESNAILFAFLIQFVIFFSTQYFEFSVGQINEKKNIKK